MEDADQLIRIKADYIISAFGSELGGGDVAAALAPVKLNKWGLPDVDPVTMATTEPGVFCGGDIAGVANVRIALNCLKFTLRRRQWSRSTTASKRRGTSTSTCKACTASPSRPHPNCPSSALVGA